MRRITKSVLYSRDSYRGRALTVATLSNWPINFGYRTRRRGRAAPPVPKTRRRTSCRRRRSVPPAGSNAKLSTTPLLRLEHLLHHHTTLHHLSGRPLTLLLLWLLLLLSKLSRPNQSTLSHSLALRSMVCLLRIHCLRSVAAGWVDFQLSAFSVQLWLRLTLPTVLR